MQFDWHVMDDTVYIVYVCMHVCQRYSEVEYHQVYNTTTPPPQPSPPAPWYRSRHVTATLCRATPGTVLQDLDSRPEVRTSPALYQCCCVLNRTQLAARTHRRGTAVANVSLLHRRRITSWVLRTSASLLRGYCLVLSSGPGTYRSSPTYRHAHTLISIHNIIIALS